MLSYAKPEKKQAPKNTVQKEGRTEAPPYLNQTGIPDGIKSRFENLSGFSFDDVRVHYNSDKPAQLQALAYTQGNQVYVGPGQESHLEHELGHVVQQKQGIVSATGSQNGLPVNDDAAMEAAADRIGAQSVQMKKAAPSDGVVQKGGDGTSAPPKPSSTLNPKAKPFVPKPKSSTPSIPPTHATPPSTVSAPPSTAPTTGATLTPGTTSTPGTTLPTRKDRLLQVQGEMKTALGIANVTLNDVSPTVMSETAKQMNSVFIDFPQLKGYVDTISTTAEADKGGNAIFASTFYDDKSLSKVRINFNPTVYADYSSIKSRYEEDVKKKHHPEKTDYSHTGVHELGHAIVAQIVYNESEKKGGVSDDDRIKDVTDSCATAKEIVDSAVAKMPAGTVAENAKKDISTYAAFNAGETVSEAMADYYANKDSAKPLSREIFKIVHERYSNLFSPKGGGTTTGSAPSAPTTPAALPPIPPPPPLSSAPATPVKS